jgi:hypothetical protein
MQALINKLLMISCMTQKIASRDDGIDDSLLARNNNEFSNVRTILITVRTVTVAVS